MTDLQLLTELDENPLPVTSEVDGGSLLRDSVHDARETDPTRTWVLDLSAERLVVSGDAHHLRQVVTNVLNNVRVHTPPGTVATVRASRRGGSVVIEVSDDGPALPVEDLDRVFDRFWRHDPSRSRASGGSGLGLSIVAAIVAAHGGTAKAT
nr:ATP-binding protein [Micromonospora sp. DSM 115978]